MLSKTRISGRGTAPTKSVWARIAVLFFIGMLSGSIYTRTEAQVVYNPTNGHYYEVVKPTTLDWLGAKADAQTRNYQGLRGHLATITSAAEDQFVTTNLPEAVTLNVVLGGYQDRTAPDYSEPAGGWRWVTGEPWNYTDWSPGEPNNSNGNEDFLHFLANGHWNDFPGAGPQGYVCEYESYPPLFHYDFDGDGKADLVLQNQNTNQVAVWNMNGLTVSGGTLVASVPLAGYQVVGTADFNGDGHPDLLFQNQTTGQAVLWYMNGVNFLSGGPLSYTPAANYQVVAPR